MLAEVIQAAVVRLALVQSDLDPTSHPGVRGPVDHEQGSVRHATDVHHRARRAAGTGWPGRPGSASRRARRRPRRRSRSEIRDPDPAALMAQMAVVLNGPGGRAASPAAFVVAWRRVTTTSSPSLRSTSVQRRAATSLRRSAPWKSSPTIAPSTKPRRSAVSFRSRPRPVLRRCRQPPGLSAAGGGDFGAAEVVEGLASERPAGRLLAGGAGGPAGGGDGHRRAVSTCRSRSRNRSGSFSSARPPAAR